MSERLPLLYEAETRSLIGGFLDCYNHIGFGFAEPSCCSALARGFIQRGHTIAREVAIEVFYKGESVGWQRMDFVVDDKIIVEVKATPILSRNARRQLRSCMKSTRLHVGLLFHFGPKPLFFREYSEANKFKPTDRLNQVDRPNPKTPSVDP